ncbi:hypothetical protein LCGC14_2896810, partial [marine sediment metagenome]
LESIFTQKPLSPRRLRSSLQRPLAVGKHGPGTTTVRDYLEQPANERALKDRAAFKRGDCLWWRYTWPLHKELYHRPRLVCPYRTGHNRFVVVEDFRLITLTDTTVAFKHVGQVRRLVESVHPNTADSSTDNAAGVTQHVPS